MPLFAAVAVNNLADAKRNYRGASRQSLPLQVTPETIRILDFGLLLPAQHLQSVAAQITPAVYLNWCKWNDVRQPEKRRSVASFAAAGSSGTGKTRFGAECAALILAQLQLQKKPEDSKLISAMEHCVKRGLSLRFDFRSGDDNVRSADVLWKAYCSSFGVSPPPPSPSGGVNEVYAAIAAVERSVAPFEGPIAVLVHLDEVQHLKPIRLGELISAFHEPFEDHGPPQHGIFPIVYVSGTDQLQVQATLSSREPTLLSLPLLRCDD